MTETEAIINIVKELQNIRVMLALIVIAILLILFCKRCYSHTDGIKDAIKELTRFLKSRR